VSEAAERIRQIIRELRETLRELQVVLELLEKAKAEKQADAEQIEDLERALNELQGSRPSRRR